MLKKCFICKNEIDISFKESMNMHRRADNIFVCSDCFQYYIEHRIIYPFTCKYCGTEFEMTKMMFVTRNFDGNLQNICKTCKKKAGTIQAQMTNLKRHGVSCSLLIPQAQAKTIQTNRKRFGCDNAASSPLVKEKIAKKFKENYGMHPFSTKEIQDKRKQKCMELYGVDNPSKSPLIKDKMKERFIENYGVDNPSKSPIIQERINQTFKENYGMHPFSTKEIQDKRKQKCMELYGVEYPGQSPEIKAKIKRTNDAKSLEEKEKHIQKILFTKSKRTKEDKEKTRNKTKHTLFVNYGVDATNPSQVPSIRQKIVSSAKKSSLEEKFANLLTNTNIQFQRQYVIKQHNCIHAFDFAIFQSGELTILVDIDGLFFHAYIGDADGKLQRDDYDSKRTQCIPEGVKFLVVFEKQLLEGFSKLCTLLQTDYNSYINDLFIWCRKIGFPYPSYSVNQLVKSYNDLCRFNYFIKNGKIGERLIRHFHHSIYHAHRNNKPSPYDGYMNDELLMKVIHNRFLYKNELEPSRILEGFNISKIAPKVSIFKPSLTKTLVNTYLNEYNEVFDPFSGYSGRMLGVCATGKHYIGQDLNYTTVEESNKLIQFLSLDAKVEQKDILASTGEYECLFTCPPYGDKEIWGTETEFRSADDWITECLNRFKCHTYLFVVDETVKYKNCIIDTIINKSHFGTNTEIIIKI